MKSQINLLRLVYPPISNQEAEWLKDDPEVQECIKTSNLYMICQREEAQYRFDEKAQEHFADTRILNLQLETSQVSLNGSIDVDKLLTYRGIDLDTHDVEIELGPKMIRFWAHNHQSGEKSIIDWFLCDKLLWDISRKHPAISGFDGYKNMSRYFLHYVGISKQDDSLTRLVIKPHDKRLRILSNEASYKKIARLTDEIFLLFFTVSPLRITEIVNPDDIDEMVGEDGIALIPIICDAERAFTKVLKSQYNKIQYKAYPKMDGGLYDQGLKRYLYVVAEDIRLDTATDFIRGGYVSEYDWPNDQDIIFIEKGTVTLIKHDNSQY